MDTEIVKTQEPHTEIVKSPTNSPSYIGSFVKSLVHRRLVGPLQTDFSNIEVRVVISMNVVLTPENPSLFKL